MTAAQNENNNTLFASLELVNYIRSRLPVGDLFVSRVVPCINVQEVADEDYQPETYKVNLSTLSDETPLRRTDVSQLFIKIFSQNNMLKAEDNRHVNYSDDADLVSLLVQHASPEDADAIRDGSYKLSIFNVQRFTKPYLNKAARLQLV